MYEMIQNNQNMRLTLINTRLYASNKISGRYSTGDKSSNQPLRTARQVAFVSSRAKSKTSPVIFTAVPNCSFAGERLDARVFLRPSRRRSLNVS